MGVGNGTKLNLWHLKEKPNRKQKTWKIFRENYRCMVKAHWHTQFQMLIVFFIAFYLFFSSAFVFVRSANVLSQWELRQTTSFRCSSLFCVSNDFLDECIKWQILRRCRMINSIIWQWKKVRKTSWTKIDWAQHLGTLYCWLFFTHQLLSMKDKALSVKRRKTIKPKEKKKKEAVYVYLSAYVPLRSSFLCILHKRQWNFFPITSIRNEWLGKTVHNFNGIICARSLFGVSSNFNKQMKIGSKVDAKNQMFFLIREMTRSHQ